MRAEQILLGRNPELLTHPMDIEWAHAVHQTPAEATGIIMTGNADAPDALYYTFAPEPNDMGADYQLHSITRVV